MVNTVDSDETAYYFTEPWLVDSTIVYKLLEITTDWSTVHWPCTRFCRISTQVHLHRRVYMYTKSKTDNLFELMLVLYFYGAGLML